MNKSSKRISSTAVEAYNTGTWQVLSDMLITNLTSRSKMSLDSHDTYSRRRLNCVIHEFKEDAARPRRERSGVANRSDFLEFFSSSVLFLPFFFVSYHGHLVCLKLYWSFVSRWCFCFCLKIRIPAKTDE